MIEHFDSANGGITFQDIHTLSRGSSGANDAEQGQPAGRKRNDEQREKREREKERRGRPTSECGVAPWCSQLFYSLNIGPNQTPSALRAREYKCSPSRLYNHGSVKLTSQSCNQPRNSAGTDERDPNSPWLDPCRSEIFAVPEFKSVPARGVLTVDKTFK